MNARDHQLHPRAKRVHKRVVSKAELARVAEFLQLAGRVVAAVEVSEGKVRIITDAGKGLTLPPDGDDLDAELDEHMKNRGYG